MKRTKNTEVPLVIEEYPDDYNGYPFVTLVQQSRSTFLTIIDSMERGVLGVFVLDLCSPEGVDESQIIELAAEWYEHSRDQYPISIEFSKRGLTYQTSKIYRTLNVDYITRIIGPVPKFPALDTVRIKRRKVKTISENTPIRERLVFHEAISCVVRGSTS